jgi:hypothetical protein
MNAQTPSDHVREVVMAFLESSGFLPLVDVGYGRTPQGDKWMSLKPRATDAADLVVQTATARHSHRYLVNVFVAGEARPIEIAGPINENVPPPFRTAEEDLLEILHLVATGQVFDEVDDDGEVLSTDVPDPRTAPTSTTGTERRRRWYKPWA